MKLSGQLLLDVLTLTCGVMTGFLMSNLNEVVQDIEVPDAVGDGPRYKEQSLRIFCVMNPPSTWSLPGVLEDGQVSVGHVKFDSQSVF